jgi:hypothetical protein
MIQIPKDRVPIDMGHIFLSSKHLPSTLVAGGQLLASPLWLVTVYIHVEVER